MLLRLVTGNPTFHNFRTASILRNPSVLRQNFRSFVRDSSAKVRKGEKLFLNRPLTLALGLGTSVLLRSRLATVKCDASRITDLQASSNAELKFDWRRLWKYLKGHIWKLLGAIAAALAVAYFNINIPSLLGQLVNALSKYAGDAHGTANDFLQVSRSTHDELLVKTFLHILGRQGASLTTSALLPRPVDLHIHLYLPPQSHRRADGLRDPTRLVRENTHPGHRVL